MTDKTHKQTVKKQQNTIRRNPLLLTFFCVTLLGLFLIETAIPPSKQTETTPFQALLTKELTNAKKQHNTTEQYQNIRTAWTQLPLHFEAHESPATKGKTKTTRYLARGVGYSLGIEADAIYLMPQTANSDQAIHMRFVDAQVKPPFGLTPLPGKVHYLKGNQPKHWRKNISTYATVQQNQLYPGIDIRYYGKQGKLEYDLIVAPNANIAQVQLAFNGIDSINLDKQGNLLLKTAQGIIRQQKPHIYQEIEGQRQIVQGDYQMLADNRIGFNIQPYNAHYALVIDPILDFSTYIGGEGTEEGISIAVDEDGSAYITGVSASTNFPSNTPYQQALAGDSDVFIAKFNPEGDGLIYATYLGGSHYDSGKEIVVDSSGHAYITGVTRSDNDFPTENPLQANYGGGYNDAFISKLSPDGSQLLFSTYLGGGKRDHGVGIALDDQSDIYLTGMTRSDDFPIENATQATLSGGFDAYIVKLNSDGSQLHYASYIGGSGNELATAIAVDSRGYATITGSTSSKQGFPLENAIQTKFGGKTDAFITQLIGDGSGINYSSYLGGSNRESGNGVAFDSQNNAIIVGEVSRSRRRAGRNSFPLLNAFQTKQNGRSDGFISKLSVDGNDLLFSTFLGGNGTDRLNKIAIDNNDDLYVVGTTQSTTALPIIDAIQAELNTEDGNKADVYIAKLSNDGSTVIYASYLGGSQSDSGIDIAVNRQDAYITGSTQSNESFPLQNPTQELFGGGIQDAFMVKIAADNRAPEILSLPSTTAGINQPYHYAIKAQDEDGDSLSYQLLTAPTAMAIDSEGVISWIADSVGQFEVQLQVSDGEQSVTQSWTINVVNSRPNRPPSISSTPLTTATIDTEYSYPVIATDPDGDALNYQLLQAPLGLNINPTTGEINWTPTDAGDYAVQVRVDDSQAQAEQSWTIHINYSAGFNPPTLTAIDNLTAPLGSVFKLQLQGNDIDGDKLIYGSDPMPLPKGMTLNAETGGFLFTPAPDQVGEHSITFSVSDGRFIAKQSLVITVPALSTNTRLVGRVITTDAQPLANVRLETEGIETFSDANGDFSFNNLSESGQVRLLVDGSTVSPILGTFATVPEIIKVIAGANNKVEPAIVLLPLDVASADPVRPFKTSIITSSRFKNIDGSTSEPVTLTIPAGRAVKEDGTPFVGDIHISRIEDPTQGPRPLPDDIGLSVYIAMQPFGVIYPNPVPISFPNVEGFPSESIMDVFALDHATGRFEKIGEARVSADGKTIDSVGGIVKSNSWHGITPQAPVTKKEKSDKQDKQEDECKSDACTFNIESGNLGESHNLPSYFSLGQARSVRLNYNSMSANPRPILNASSTIGNFSPPPTSMSSRLSVGGIEQGGERFGGVITEPANTRGSFKSGWVGVQFDAELFETGIYNYDWIVDCHFPISRRSETLNGRVIVQNEINSALGAGWTISGLRQLHINAEGLALMTEGNGIAVTFTPTNTDTFDSPPADFSSLTRNADNAFTRRMKDGTQYHFDQRGFQTAMVDRNGNTTQYRYDTEDRLDRITDPLGKTFIFNYSSSGYLDSITDAANRTTRFQHDSEGNLIRIIEPTGDQRSFEYQSGSHLLTAQTDQRNNRKEYSYDFAGRISSALLADGSTVELRPSTTKGLIDPESGLGTSKNNLAPKPPLTEDIRNTYTDQNGNISRTETDERSAPTKKSDAVGRVTLIQRDGDSNPTQTTRPNLSVINRIYDNQGNIITSTEQFNGAISRYSYDDFSLITSVTNSNNHTTTINRNAITSNVESVINHLGHTSQMRYYPNGLIKQSTSPNGLVTDYLYNTQQLPQTITQIPPAESPGNTRISSYTYYPTGLLKQVITPDGITLNSVYDDKGRRLTVTDNLGQSVEYFYDGYNNLIKTDTQNADSSLALQAEQFYDSRNRLFEIKAPHNETEDSVTSWEMDNNSNLKVLTDANGNSASNLYDREDRLLENSHRLEGVTAYQYDTENRITQVTAPNGVITQYTYDVLGRKLTENSPDRGLLSYSYDLANNITGITEGRGIEVSYSYDELERIKTATYPNTIAGKDETVTYRYDNCDFGIGRLCQIEDESGITDYDYDAYGNIISKTHTELGINYTTRYQYDDGDRLSQITYPSGKIITIARDVLRRTQAINATLNGKAKTLVSNIQYRADNQMTQCTFGNGLIDNRAYDLQGRLTQQSLKTAQNSVIDQRSYGYDKNGNILNIDTNVEDDSFQYDALDRLIQQAQDASSPVGYGYDLNDNRIARSAVDLVFQGFYDYKPESNQLLRQETLFDSAQPVPPAIANRELVYNDAGRLYQLLEEGVLKAEYIYNSQGQRTRKSVFDVDGNSLGTTVYHYSRGALIEETDALGQVVKSYVWNGMTLTAQVDHGLGGERLTYLYSDHLYTARLGVNEGQSVVWRWEGEAFGSELAEELAGIVVNMRFPGQYFDGESGLNYNWNRYYDSGLGRYITSDPIGLRGGLNSYGYAGGSPVGSMDPFGLAIYQYPGNYYTDQYNGNSGCTKPVWQGGYILTWVPCDEPENEPDSSCQTDGADSSGDSSSTSSPSSASRPYQSPYAGKNNGSVTSSDQDSTSSSGAASQSPEQIYTSCIIKNLDSVGKVMLSAVAIGATVNYVVKNPINRVIIIGADVSVTSVVTGYEVSYIVEGCKKLSNK